eukprot:4391423-Amphidinium_carterae.1
MGDKKGFLGFQQVGAITVLVVRAMAIEGWSLNLSACKPTAPCLKRPMAFHIKFGGSPASD